MLWCFMRLHWVSIIGFYGWLVDLAQCVETLERIFSNVVEHPGEEKYQRVSKVQCCVLRLVCREGSLAGMETAKDP